MIDDRVQVADTMFMHQLPRPPPIQTPPPLNFHIFKLFDKKLNHFLGTSSRLNKGFTDSNVTMLKFIVNDCVFRSGSDLFIKLKIESGVCYK